MAADESCLSCHLLLLLLLLAQPLLQQGVQNNSKDKQLNKRCPLSPLLLAFGFWLGFGSSSSLLLLVRADGPV
jgi:hypothetical protein